MSAFMCSNAHIMQVVALLGDFDQWVGFRGPDSYDKRTRLGRKLVAMNKAAIWQRYGESVETQPFKWCQSYVVRNNMGRVAQAKLLHCLLYQCAEGDVPKWALYKRLEMARCIIDHWFMRDETTTDQYGVRVPLLLSDHPEWAEAQWSI